MTHQQSAVPDPKPRLDEMNQLFMQAERFASLVREELQHLSDTRDEFLRAVERDGEHHRREAESQATNIVDEARKEAKSILAEAYDRAAKVTEHARFDHEVLVEVNRQYREVLLSTFTALEGLPELPTDPPGDVLIQMVPPNPPPMTADAAARFRDAAERSP